MGTQSGQIFRLKVNGIVEIHGNGCGDQFVKVNVEIPTRLTRQQKELLEEFALISGAHMKIGKKSLFRKFKELVF